MFYVVYHHHSIISFVCVYVCVDPLSIVSIILWTKLNLPFGYIIICQSLVMVLNRVCSVHINRWTGLTDHVVIAIFHIRLIDHVVIVIFHIKLSCPLYLYTICVDITLLALSFYVKFTNYYCKIISCYISLSCG